MMHRREPSVLVQVHYHDRLGGVQRVMADYSRAFSEHAGSEAPNIWWCRRGDDENRKEALVEDLPGADYHSFISKETYRRACDRLIRILLRRLRGLAGSGPVAVVGHNLVLGKNPALSGAFTQCAKVLSAENGANFRFFSVLHDYVEQGRFELLRNHSRLSACGVDIAAALYAKDAPVHFIAPDRLARKITGLSGQNLSILPNRVAIPDNASRILPATTVLRHLRQCAAIDGLTFDPALPVFCYPSRMIYRKNMLEALLFSTILNKGTLVTGPCGSTGADRRRMNAALRLARGYRLSMAVDPGRLRMFSVGNASGIPGGNPFHKILPSVHAAVSTSLAEGFGYSFYEPWLFGVPVVGRFPDGIALLSDAMGESLYTRVPIPASWVSIDACYNRYRLNAETAVYGSIPLKKEFIKGFIHEGTVDFGYLSTAQQVTVIERILHSDSLQNDLVGPIETERNKRSEGGEAPGGDFVVKRRVTEIAAFCDRDFTESFVKILSCTPGISENRSWYRNIASRYRHQDRRYIITPTAGTD
ncbi:MAG: hypothetical protein JW863_05125 [Chitinispirillaceae bacterium]|nr:hypothetical protein [Chitinispirillaceae bacterium]